MISKYIGLSVLISLITVNGCSLTEIRCNMQRAGSNPDIVNFPECRKVLLEKQRKEAKKDAEDAAS